MPAYQETGKKKEVDDLDSKGKEILKADHIFGKGAGPGSQQKTKNHAQQVKNF